MVEYKEPQPDTDVELSDPEKSRQINELYRYITSYFDASTHPLGWKIVEKPAYGTIGEYSYESGGERWKVEEVIPQKLYLRRTSQSAKPDISDIAFVELNAGNFGSHDIYYGSMKVDTSSREVISSPPMEMNTHRALELANTLAHALRQN